MYDPKLMDMLNDYQEALPGMMQAVGMTGVATNLIEFIKIYLYGFLMLIFPLIFSIMIGNSFIMRYVETGSMACLLATPNSRKKIIITQALSMIVSIMILMVLITVIGATCSNVMFPGKLDIMRYIELNISTLLMQLVIGGIVFLAAAIFNESRYFYTFGAGIPLLFFLIKMLSNMGEKLDNLKYFTVYTLLPLDDIVAGNSDIWIYNVVMGLLIIVLYSGGILYFTKKDLSL